MPFVRLGLETARIPHVDRYGLIWLGRGELYVSSGTLRFRCAGIDGLPPGEYDIPYQNVSMILLAPGTTITHDVFRLTANHGTSIIAVGEDGVRMYTAPPFGPDRSILARRQVSLWANLDSRNQIARKMYAIRLGEVFPRKDIAALRGLEGARTREIYKRTAQKFGIKWNGRRYDRSNPDAADLPNQAINHASTAVQAAAEIAVAATATIPQLGFIHEDSSRSFALDIADLFRDVATLPIAFTGVSLYEKDPAVSLERHVRKLAGREFSRRKLIPDMIEKIKEILGDANDTYCNE
jgi:CRISPR-associated protein Cas1